MIVIACGSRGWTDEVSVINALDRLRENGPLDVMEGGARGADMIAGAWAASKNGERVGWLHMPADWARYGKAAGPIRNRRMLERLVDGFRIDGNFDGVGVVVAFKDGFDWSFASGGTENMVAQACAVGVPSAVLSHEGVKILPGKAVPPSG